MSYAEQRDGKLTGRWCGAATVKVDGVSKRLRHFFETKKEADGYEVFVQMMGYEPPGLTQDEGLGGQTFKEVANACKAAGGPRGRWKRGKDKSVLQRVDFVTNVLGAFPIASIKTADMEGKGKLMAALDAARIGGRPLSNGTKA